MRKNMSMMERSDKVDESTIRIIREELSDILVSGILNYPQTLEQVGITPASTFEERKRALGLAALPPSHNEKEIRFLESMADKADSCRRANWKWRVSEEAEQKHKLGWHPFFVTLTVDPKLIDPKTLWQEGREFRKYIRKLVNIVCAELGHPPAHKRVVKNKQIVWDYRPESDYLTYCGVIEHGVSREHHHGHFLIWMRAIPPSWRIDPNAGIRNPLNRVRTRCLEAETLWPWSDRGRSQFKYFRSIADIWEIGYKFCLPVKDGRPLKVSVPRVAGVYLMKYMSKDLKEWNHRVKATRNLGLKRLKETISSLDQESVEALTWRASNSSTNLSALMTHSVPLGLVRSVAKQKLFLMQYRRSQLDLTKLLQPSCDVFSKMLSSVRAGIRPDRMHSSAFFDWVAGLLPVPSGYCEERLRQAHGYLARNFPPDRALIQHVKMGANDIGYT